MFEKSESYGLSQNDQIIVMVVVAVVLLLISVAVYIFSVNFESIPEQFRPNARPFFDQLQSS